MGTRTLKRPGKRPIAAIIALVLLFPAVLVAAGCDSNTPEGAVEKMLGAWEAHDWEAYKSAIVPGQKLSKAKDEIAKQEFEGQKLKFEGIKTKTQIDSKDKNKAAVTLTDGKITVTAKVLGKQKTETQDFAKMDPKARPVYDVSRINGVWYVDMML